MELNKNNSLGFALTTTLNTLRKKFNADIKKYNISSEQFAVLKLIEEYSKLIPSKIAEILGRDRANITRILNSLEKKNYIKKEFLNAKSYNVLLTDKGHNVLKEAEKIALEYHKKILNLISEEDLNCIIEKLNKIRDSF